MILIATTWSSFNQYIFPFCKQQVERKMLQDLTLPHPPSFKSKLLHFGNKMVFASLQVIDSFRARHIVRGRQSYLYLLALQKGNNLS